MQVGTSPDIMGPTTKKEKEGSRRGQRGIRQSSSATRTLRNPKRIPMQEAKKEVIITSSTTERSHQMALEFNLPQTTIFTQDEEIKKETVTVTHVHTQVRTKGSDGPWKPAKVRTHVDLAYADRFKVPIEEGKKRLESTQDGNSFSRGERVALAAFAKKVNNGDIAIGEDAVREAEEAARKEAEAKAAKEAAKEAEAEASAEGEEGDNMDLDSCPSDDLENDED